MGTFGGCNHNACSASKILCSFLSLSPQVSGILQIFLTELIRLKPILTIGQGKLVFPQCLLVSVSLRAPFLWRRPELPTSQPRLLRVAGVYHGYSEPGSLFHTFCAQGLSTHGVACQRGRIGPYSVEQHTEPQRTPNLSPPRSCEWVQRVEDEPRVIWLQNT